MRSWKMPTVLGVVLVLLSCADYNLLNQYTNPLPGRFVLNAPDAADIDSSSVILHWSKDSLDPDQYAVYKDTMQEEKITDSILVYLGTDTTARISDLSTGHYYAFWVSALKNKTRIAVSNTVVITTRK